MRMGCAEHGEGDEVLGEQLLLAAEAAADPRGEDAHVLRGEAEDVAQLVAHEVGHLRARAQHEAPVGVEPSPGRVGLEGGVAHALGLPGSRDDRGGLGDRGVDVAHLRVHLGEHVA
jgi:hypothetical protein